MSVSKQPHMVIVGSGVSGMMCALQLAFQKIPVTLVCLSSHADSSELSEGLGAAINPQEVSDSVDCHFAESVIGGEYLAGQKLLHSLCEAAPGLVAILNRMGVCFDQTAEGNYQFYNGEGSRYARTVASKVGLGRVLVQALQFQVSKLASQGLITRFIGWEFCSLVKDDQGRCLGIVAMDCKTLQIKVWSAAAVILCTGGLGALFKKNTESDAATGSAASVVYQQGGLYANGEFIQFDPPRLAGAAASDSIAAVSYSLGGLWVDENFMTSIAGVFAAGECQYQYHGAGVLAGNRLLASVHSGLMAALGAKHYGEVLEHRSPVSQATDKREEKNIFSQNQQLFDARGVENPFRLFDELQTCLTDNLGSIRSNKNLSFARRRIQELKSRYHSIKLDDGGRYFNRSLIFARELWNALELAEVLVTSALYRNESRGCHYKVDFPRRDDEQFLKTTLARYHASGPQISYENVDLHYLKPC